VVGSATWRCRCQSMTSSHALMRVSRVRYSVYLHYWYKSTNTNAASLETQIVMFVAFSSEGSAAHIVTAFRYLCAGAGTAGTAQSNPPANATYSYGVFQASGLLALANITAYGGTTRGATFSPPPPIRYPQARGTW